MNDTIRFSLDHLGRVNYAAYENSLNMIRKLHIENHGAEDILEAVLRVSALPEVIPAQEISIPRLPAGKSVDLGQVPSELSTEFILSLTELVQGELTLSLTFAGEEVRAAYPIEVLPFDSWAGAEEAPELLAAFATPHHPVISNLVVRAGDLLKDLTGSGTFDGYGTGDPNQVLRQVSAVYSAVRELALYELPAPAEFLREGQRIRLADELTEKGQGSSLDLTMLFTSLLEAVGLNPVILLFEERTLAGVWLTRETFPETINYDVTALTRRAAKGMSRIALLDTSLVTAGKGGDFNEALARGHLALEEPEDFYCSLDLRRARSLRIRPLPVRVLEQGKYVLQRPDEQTFDEAVLPEAVVMLPGEGPSLAEKLPKQKVWERKLLDLSLRNSLLNYRPDRSGIPLIVHDLTRFTGDLLADGEFSLNARPQEWDKARSGVGKREPDAALFRDLASVEYDSGRIPVLMDQETLEERGQKLVKGARSALEETGASSLYLALGILAWHSKDDPETRRLAPLVLIPVEAETRGHLAGLTLRSREEEAHFNITLKEMLKNDFGILLSGLDPLPESGGSLDLLKIFSKVRSAVLRQTNWDILEEAHLGLFSFSKFIMWNDLSRNLEEFSKNKIVDSLLAGRLNFQTEPLALEEQFLDDEPENQDIIYPVSSDASQSLAVLASVQGKSYVLHGPPGTGKSQTITNIIANALLQDKRVLFVAQKMAALEVVEKRLNSIGIGSFCLELHSSKARKKAVLDQLEASMKIQRIPKNRSFEEEKERVRREKGQLNTVVKKLYRVDESGYSLYDLITENSKLRDFEKYIDLAEDFQARDLKTREAVLVRLSRMGSHAGGPYGHPLRGIGAVSFGPLMKEAIQAAAELDLDSLAGALDELLGPAPDDYLPATFQETEEIVPELKSILAVLRTDPRLDSLEKLQAAADELHGLEQELRIHEDHRASILDVFLPEALQEDSERMLKDFNAFETQNVLGRIFRKNPVEKQLNLYSRTGPLDKGRIPALLSGLTAFARESGALAKKQKGLASVPEAFSELTAEAVNARRILLDEVVRRAGSSERYAFLAGLAGRIELPTLLRHYEEMLTGEGAGIRRFLELTAFEEEELKPYSGNWFQRMKEKLQEILGSLDLLRDWLMYKEAEKEAHGQGLKEIADLYHNGHVSDRELLPAFKKSMLRRELKRRLEEEDLLLNLTGHSLDEQAASLKEQLERLELLERKELYFHLASKVPNMVLEKETSQEIAILQRALRSGARNLSLRSLFAETGQLLGRIAPCMLMSPMSVAQYVSPEAGLFDLVIFDEASQIPTSEAIGALGRAKEAIIVGDPRQLPPTSFFMAQTSGEGPEENGDLDSILEDCLALSMPESHLLWHYRSRHESLIAFSNRNFYDGSLYTYPSPDDLVSRVSLRQTGGVYERGTARVNRTEAAAVAREVVRRLNDPALRQQSMGIVTFSVVQQSLIEELIAEEVASSPGLEQALLELPEPLFVKNLENVQGDERDVIIFSIGYGPDEAGRLTMNFGPINQEGGWRRLNVAVTRARLEMVVFTNIDPDRFQVSEAQPRGVRDLKAFLDFAGKGTRTLTLEDVRRDEATENLNQLIADKLRERGWRVETAIGTSRFKVDLGVMAPDGSDRFILGIMCGGASTREARAAYDREILQGSVLKGLGWDLHRIYAVDWLENEEREIDRIETLLKDRLSGRKQVTPAAMSPADGEAGGERPYRSHALPRRPLSLDEFLKVANAGVISAELVAIIDAEGPISRSLLTKRAVTLYGLPRATERTMTQVEQILNKVRPRVTKLHREMIYWTQGQDPEQHAVWRKTLPEDTDRLLNDIAPEEVMACLVETLNEPKAERTLIRDLSAALGYPRLNIDNEQFLKNILDMARLKGVVKQNDQGQLVIAPGQLTGDKELS